MASVPPPVLRPGQGRLAGTVLRAAHPSTCVLRGPAVVGGIPGHGGWVGLEVAAYDWLGRQFALHRGDLVEGLAQVRLFDPGFHQVLNIPCSFETLHRAELPEYADDALAARFHAEWLASGGAAPGLAECIGYRIPPTLGGKDEIANMELTDMDVYWELS